MRTARFLTLLFALPLPAQDEPLQAAETEARWRATLQEPGAGPKLRAAFAVILVGRVTHFGKSPGIWAGGVVPTFQPVHYEVVEELHGAWGRRDIWAHHILLQGHTGVRGEAPVALDPRFYRKGRTFILQLQPALAGEGVYALQEWGTGNGDAIPATEENLAALRKALGPMAKAPRERAPGDMPMDGAVVAELEKLEKSPGVWAGARVPVTQRARYAVSENLRGPWEKGAWLAVDNLLSKGARGVREDRPGLDPGYHRQGERFLLQVGLRWSTVDQAYAFGTRAGAEPFSEAARAELVRELKGKR